jgi:hypothetical protein
MPRKFPAMSANDEQSNYARVQVHHGYRVGSAQDCGTNTVEVSLTVEPAKNNLLQRNRLCS